MVMFVENPEDPFQNNIYLTINLGSGDNTNLELETEGTSKRIKLQATFTKEFDEDIYTTILNILEELDVGDVILLSPRTISEDERVENYDTFAAPDKIIINYTEVDEVTVYQFLIPGNSPITLRSDQVKLNEIAVKIIVLEFLEKALINKIPSFVKENLLETRENFENLLHQLVTNVAIRYYKSSTS